VNKIAEPGRRKKRRDSTNVSKTKTKHNTAMNGKQTKAHSVDAVFALGLALLLGPPLRKACQIDLVEEQPERRRFSDS